jgi:hypothetical protein
MGIAAVSLAAAAVAAPLATSSAASPPSASSGIPATAAQRLTGIVARAAEMDGDAKPVWIEAVSTSRDKALAMATPGDTIPGSVSQPVYLVVMKGNFTLNDFSTPPNTRAPTGSYLSLTYDPATFLVMDIGITNDPPPDPLQSLGPVSTLAQQK